MFSIERLDTEPAHSRDAAMSFSLHIGHPSRGASDGPGILQP